MHFIYNWNCSLNCNCLNNCETISSPLLSSIDLPPCYFSRIVQLLPLREGRGVELQSLLHISFHFLLIVLLFLALSVSLSHTHIHRHTCSLPLSPQLIANTFPLKKVNLHNLNKLIKQTILFSTINFRKYFEQLNDFDKISLLIEFAVFRKILLLFSRL